MYLMQIAAVAQLSDGVFQGVNANRPLLLAPAHLLLQVGPLSIKGLVGFLQLPARLPLACRCR